MQATTLRTRRFAAALLLSPIAAAMVATPAVAQNAAPGQRVAANAAVQSPSIERFTVPGVYEGSYTIRLRDDLSEIDRAVATLRNGPMTTSARIVLEGEGAQWPDRVGPKVVDVTPNHNQHVGERGRTEVSARYRDDRSGVNVSSVRLRIDGDDVTRQARVTGNKVSFEANLRQGRHQAELVVRDRAGNVTRTAWNFVVDNDIRGNNGVSLGYGR
ncbi:MAG: hypothetical protein K0S48_780 [Ramlibacter sp.]|nr:hypothetical protein [Ramlibacter sp.]